MSDTSFVELALGVALILIIVIVGLTTLGFGSGASC